MSNNSNYNQGWSSWSVRDWAALDQTASRLKLEPNQLAALIHQESSGRPTVWGGDGGQYYGLIQFGPGARKSTGINPELAKTPADQMPYIEKYLLGAGFKPGKHGIKEAYSSILAGNPYSINAADSNGTTAANSANKFLPGGEYYNLVSTYRKGKPVQGFQNTSSTTSIASSTLNVDVKPFDFDSKLMQVALNSGISAAPIANSNISTPSADPIRNSRLTTDRNQRIGSAIPAYRNRAVDAFVAIEGQQKQITEQANKNIGNITGGVYGALNQQNEYNQKIDLLKNTLTGASDTNAQLANSSSTANTHTYVTGNTGRSSGPHLDFRVKMLDTKTGSYVYDDPKKYIGALSVNGQPVDKLFPVTSPWNAPRASGPHRGIDYGTPVGTKINVPSSWKFLGRFWDDGGGGWVNEYKTHTGKIAQLLHGADISKQG